MQKERKVAFFNSLRFPVGVTDLYGIPWEPLESEMVTSCKILLMGEHSQAAFECFKKHSLHQELVKHVIIPDAYYLRFNLGDHEVDVLFCVLRNDVTDIDYRQKIFENLDLATLVYNSSSLPSFSTILTKLYPQASQFSPETSLCILGVRASFADKEEIPVQQVQDLVSLTGAICTHQINLEDYSTIDLAFDHMIRSAIIERISKGNIIPLDNKRKRKLAPHIRRKFPSVVSHPRHTKEIVTELPGIPMEFIAKATVQDLEDLVANKIHNIRVVEGVAEPPLFVALQRNNADIAKKFLELENGIVNLSDCSLEKIPPELIIWAEQGLIKEINLSQNMLQAIPVSFRHIKRVDIVQNPLQTIPHEIRFAKWSKVRKYLEQIATRAAQWNIRKLLLIGEEAVGKSTLVRCLEAKTGKTDIAINLATDGIDIKSIEIRGESKEAVMFSTWDMGGQIVFYPTHQFFLSNAGIYILVFNMENIQFPRIEYWMKQIKLLGNDCSALLIMVGTHCENCSEEKIEQIKQRILTKYPRYAYPAFQAKIFPVSAKTGQGIRELKKCLAQLAHSSQTSPVVPAAWVQLHEMLKAQREAGTNYVNWQIYSSWASQCGLRKDDLTMATEHLHNSGSLIYFPAEELKDLVILNPQWLANIMSCLITIKNNFVVNGYIDGRHFPEIFKNYGNLIDTIIRLLEQFKIIHPMNNSNDRYLVPSLLSNSRPSADIASVYPVELPNGISTLGRVFRFSQLPLGLFGRLMVSLLQRPNVTGQVFWRNGVVTSTKISENSKLQSITEYEQDRYQLSIYIRYSPHDTNVALKEWRILLETVKTLIDSFYPQLLANMKEFVPCIHCLRKQRYRERVYLFPYSDCENAQNGGIVYCQKIPSPSRCVVVSQLAPDIFLADLPHLQSSSLTIGKLLGEGSYGKVYKATLNGDDVALKELKLSPGNPDSKKLFQEFQTEAYTMSLLNHPNIVRLYGVMLNPPRMVLQYVDGVDLFQFLHRASPDSLEFHSISQESFQWKDRLTIAFHVAQGLHYLQSITPPIVHRDFRSPNIFITNDFHALIGDFGLARVVQGSVGGALRTWQWLAPEIFDSTTENYDQRTDIYSFGIILWELAAIAIPFDNYRKTPNGSKVQDMDIKKMILQENLRPPIPREAPKEYVDLMVQCWESDPAQRPHTTKILLQLTCILQAHDVPLPPTKNELEEETKLTVSFPTVEPEKMKERSSLDELSDSVPPLADLVMSDIDRNCAILPVGDRVWIGQRNGMIKIYKLSPSGKEIMEETVLCNQKRKISQLIQIRDTILSSSEDGTVTVWNSQTLKKTYQWEPFKSETITMYMKYVVVKEGSTTQHLWIVSPFEGKITIWNMNYTLLHSITQEELIGTCAIEQHQRMVLAAADTSRRIHIYNAKTFDFVGSFTAHSSPVTKIFSFDGKIWSLSLVDIRVWVVPSNFQLECRHTFHTLASRPRAITPTAGGKILTAAMDGSVLLWDAISCSVLQEMIVSCGDQSISGIVGICEDDKQRLWCVTSSRIAVWPHSERLHGEPIHLPRAMSLDSNRARNSINRGKFIQRGPSRGARGRARRGLPPRPMRNSPTPPIPNRKEPPVDSLTRANTEMSFNNRRNRTTFIGSPVSPSIQITTESAPSVIQHEPKTPPVPPRVRLTDVKLTEKSKTTKSELKTSNSSIEELIKSPRRKKKKKIIASFEEMEQNISAKTSLSKLISIIPGLELDMIDEKHPIQITCSRVKGKLRVELTCPNGLPDMTTDSPN